MKSLKIALLTGIFAMLATPALAAPKKGSVNYQCQNNIRIKVSYQFDKKGYPMSAMTKYNNKSIMLPLDKKRSDGTGANFTNKAGFNISTDSNFNARTFARSAVMFMAPNGNIIGKDCMPR